MTVLMYVNWNTLNSVYQQSFFLSKNSIEKEPPQSASKMPFIVVESSHHPARKPGNSETRKSFHPKVELRRLHEICRRRAKRGGRRKSVPFSWQFFSDKKPAPGCAYMRILGFPPRSVQSVLLWRFSFWSAEFLAKLEPSMNFKWTKFWSLTRFRVKIIIPNNCVNDRSC